jgi:hypothetical protein
MRTRSGRSGGSQGSSAPSRCCTLLLYETQRGHLRRSQVACELVGVAGFEPAASSSRTERARSQNRCSRAFSHVRASWVSTITASDRAEPQLASDRCSHSAPKVGCRWAGMVCGIPGLRVLPRQAVASVTNTWRSYFALEPDAAFLSGDSRGGDLPAGSAWHSVSDDLPEFPGTADLPVDVPARPEPPSASTPSPECVA